MGYIIFVNDPKREKRYRGKVTIKLPYVKARTAAELQTIIQIIPKFDIPDTVKASITKKRNRSFQPAGKTELIRVAKYELHALYPQLD